SSSFRSPCILSSIPPRRSSDLIAIHAIKSTVVAVKRDSHGHLQTLAHRTRGDEDDLKNEALIVLEISLRTEEQTLHDLVMGIDSDRKSTRLNYSHVKTSYAVFC